MRTCDSVTQNCCRMEGRCVSGGIRSAACLGESNHFHSIPISPMTLVHKREKAESSVRSRTSSSSSISEKNLGFSWPVH